MILKRVIFVIVSIVSRVQADDGPIVNTAIGRIRGVRSDDGQYNMYMGVPYARVNESNPFGASLPYPNFDDIFEANDDSSICPQIEEFNYTVVGDLDCLRLNIYTPSNVNSNSRLPAFIYIFGGGFYLGFYGRFLYGPKYLVRHDVIMVTINYRLGPYGFMCLDIPEVPGNQGLKDQITALRWLKSHISAFGGDPNRMTLAGNSAGGQAIDFYLHRDNNDEKLIERVILESGTSFHTNYSEPLKDAPIVLAKYFQFETQDIYEALAFLAHVPPKDLIEAESNLVTNIQNVCIEKRFEGIESYLSANWINRELPSVRNLTVLIGVNGDELGMVRSTEIMQVREIGITLNNMFHTQHKDFNGMSKLVHQFYLGDENSQVKDSVIDFLADINFLHPVYRCINKYLNNDAGNVYFYNFSYVGQKNFVRRRLHCDGGGAYHADEIGYLFDMEFLPEEPTADDQLIIDKMTKLWTNFVKYGDPTPELTELIDVKWEPLRLNSPLYMLNINKQLSLTTNPIADRITFWDVFYEKNGHLQKLLSMK